MANNLLLDTGGLVSLLDRSQSGHADFVDCFRGWSGEVVSTEAVLTEATHLLSCVPGGSAACIDFFTSGGAILVPSSMGMLRRARTLMTKYEDLPMDFADATLVVLAEELTARTILTTDVRDFSVYRIRGRSRFRIVPGDHVADG